MKYGRTSTLTPQVLHDRQPRASAVLVPLPGASASELDMGKSDMPLECSLMSGAIVVYWKTPSLMRRVYSRNQALKPVLSC